jgi:hypothetical protein
VYVNICQTENAQTEKIVDTLSGQLRRCDSREWTAHFQPIYAAFCEHLREYAFSSASQKYRDRWTKCGGGRRRVVGPDVKRNAGTSSSPVGATVTFLFFWRRARYRIVTSSLLASAKNINAILDTTLAAVVPTRTAHVLGVPEQRLSPEPACWLHRCHLTYVRISLLLGWGDFTGGPAMTVNCQLKKSLMWLLVASISMAGSAQLNAEPAQPPAAAQVAAAVSSVAISGGATSLVTNAQSTYTATVTGSTTNKAVTWKASLGTITATGVYTAPSPGTHIITATSVADPTKSASVAVTVTAAPVAVKSITISPASANVTTNAQVSFTATIVGATTNKAVTWKASLGTITSAGVYTAPSPGTHIITATSVADPTKSVTALVVTTAPPKPVTSVTVTPGSATTITNGKVTFTAAVTGTTTNKAVTWKASLGTITSAGVYTAPSPGTHIITATSVADPTKFASASVVTTAAPLTVTSVAITPGSAAATTNATVAFTATVSGSVTNKAVTWKASLGTITASGVYTAPSAGTHIVTATSVADPTKSASATVIVTAPKPVTAVSVSPDPATSLVKGTLPFTATVTGTTTNKAVTWKASMGTITTAGVYTAPATPGTHIITATSVADPTKSDSVSVNVVAETTPPPPPPTNPVPPPPGNSEPLPPGFFGLSWNDVHTSHIPSVGFGAMRLWDTKTKWADLEPSKGRYNWVTMDEWLAIAGSHDKDVVYTFGETPTWASMRPTEACAQDSGVLGCAAPPSDVDSGDNIWKTFVTALVHHSLASSTGHIKYYEIWDEPNAPNGIFWSGTDAQLATMAKDAYEIIHALDPNALVLSPSPTGGAFSSNWMKTYWAAGGAAALDIIADHGWTKPVNGVQNTQDLLAVIDSVHAAEASYGLPEKPIWFTEGNWGKNPGTNDQQVAFLATEYLFLWSKGVSRFYWYAWDNTSGWGPLWDSTHGVHPAGVAYGLLYKWMVGSTHADNPCSEDADSTWSCKLNLADGAAAQIVWNAGGSRSFTVPSTFSVYRTLDNANVNNIVGNTVTIGPKPILLN